MGANPRIIVPFIRKWEGGLSAKDSDAAAKDRCPYPLNGIHYHTNAGITWTLWKKEYGDTLASANVFFKMPDEQWFNVYTKYFWNANRLSDLESQRIANLIANWTWGSGNYYPDKHVQHVVNQVLSTKMTEDGALGPESIKEINEAPEEILYQALLTEDEQYLKGVAANLDKTNPGTGSENLHGWLNRLEALKQLNSTL